MVDAVNFSGVVAAERHVDNRRALMARDKAIVVLPALAAGQFSEATAISDDLAVVFGSACGATGVAAEDRPRVGRYDRSGIGPLRTALPDQVGQPAARGT